MFLCGCRGEYSGRTGESPIFGSVEIKQTHDVRQTAGKEQRGWGRLKADSEQDNRLD